MKQNNKSNKLNKITAVNNFDFTELHLATLNNEIDLVHRLLVAGKDPNACIITDDVNTSCMNSENIINQLKNLGNKTPLHIAAKESLLDMGKLLIAYGANVNIIDSGLCTPLHWSAAKGDAKFAILLLDNKANPNAQDLAHSTPLHEATRNNHPDLIKILLNYNANPNIVDITGNTPITIARNNSKLSLIFSKYFYKNLH